MKNLKKTLCLFLALVMCLGMLPVSAGAVYTTYKSHVTLYAGDGSPTGTRLSVGDHYSGHWYVEEISKTHVKFGSQYGEHNNSFPVPMPEVIWTGVKGSYNTKVTYCTAFSHDVNAGANGLLIYTGGRATYANVLTDSGSSGGITDPGTETPPTTSGTYFLQVVYVNKSKTEYSFGPRVASSTTNRRWYYMNQPTVPAGFTLKGWQSSHYHGTNKFLTKSWWPVSDSTYGLIGTNSYNTTVVLNNGEGVYLIYQGNQDFAEPDKYSYILNWDYNGGTLNGKAENRQAQPDISESTATFYEDAFGKPTRDGYTFSGWTYSGNGTFTESNGQINMTGEANKTVTGTLTAQWSANPATRHTLTYDANGGTNPPSAFTGAPGSTTKISGQADMTKAGYTFVGWSLNRNAAVDEADIFPNDVWTLKDNVTLYAVWKENEVKITYKPGTGATGTDKTDTWDNNWSSYTVKGIGAVGFTKKDNYTFLHWLGSDGKTYGAGDSVSPKPSGDLTLTAIWKAPVEKATVTWYDEDGTTTLSGPMTFDKGDTEPSYTGKTPTKAENANYTYAFKEWVKMDDSTATNIKYRATYTATPKDKPNLTIEKSVDKTSIKKGGTLTYTITVTNNGKVAANDVVVTDTLPRELTYVSKSTEGQNGANVGEAKATGNALEWSLGSIAANSSVTFTFKAKTDTTGNIENTASVSCTENVTDTSDPVPTAIYSFKVEKGNDGFVSTKGKATVHYTVTITNNGTINLYGLNVKDVLTPTFKINNAALTAEQAAKVDMVLKNVTVTGADKTLSGNDLSVTDKTTTSWQSVLARNAVFAPNAEVKVEYDIEIANKTGQTLYVDLSNTATCGTWTSQEPQIITFSLRDADDGYVEESATSSASTGTSGAGGTIDPEDPDEPSTPDLEVTKTAMVFGPDGKLKGTDKAEPGDTIKYQIEVTNNGDAVENVVITDELDSNLEFVRAEGPNNIFLEGAANEPANHQYVIGDLAAKSVTNSVKTLTITVKVKDGATGTISNTATADCEDMPEDKKPSDTATVTVDDGNEPETEKVTVTFIDGYDNTEIPNSKITDWVKGETVPENRYPTRPTHDDKDPDGWKVETDGDGNITITALWKDKTTEPDTGKVTITVEFKDGDKVVKQVIEKVEKDSEYDVTDETEKLPKGYVSAGEPTGEVSGIADDDKTITVPVTKAPVEPKEKVTITIEYVDEDGTTVVKSIVETVDKGTAYDKTDEVENGIPADYTLDDAREITGEVSGTADDNVTITVPVKWSPDDPDKPQPTDTVEITIEFVDEDGNQVKSVTETVEAGTDYDKTDEATNGIPDGYELADNLPENVAGTADDNVTITVPVKKATEPEPAQVTITVKYVDEDGTEVKTVIETVDKGTAYDKSAEVENDIPNGYQANGEPTGDALIGTAEADVTITVPVKKSGSGSGETEYVTVTWLNGYDGGQVGDTQQVTKGTTSVSRDLYPANPTRADYTFSGWSDPVTGADGNITITAQWTYNSGSSGSGSGNGGGGSSGTTPTPPVDIEDEDPPLANVDGNLNTTDHFAYIIGRGEDCVQPLENITRAEVATIFFRLLTEEYRVANWSTVSSFPDVEAGAWYSTEIATAEKAGILKGCDDGNMQPNRNITRAEFTVMAIRFLNGTIEDDGIGDFADTANHWAAKEIRLAAKAGWIKGYGNEFRPNDPITRAEAMTIINRMLDRVPGETFPAGTIEWGDNPTDAWYYADVMEATNGHDYEREEGSMVEKWTAITPYRDWIALEAEWTANNGASAPASEEK